MKSSTCQRRLQRKHENQRARNLHTVAHQIAQILRDRILQQMMIGRDATNQHAGPLRVKKLDVRLDYSIEHLVSQPGEHALTRIVEYPRAYAASQRAHQYNAKHVAHILGHLTQIVRVGLSRVHGHAKEVWHRYIRYVAYDQH